MKCYIYAVFVSNKIKPVFLLCLLAAAFTIQYSWMAEYAAFSISHRSAEHMKENGRAFSEKGFPLDEILWLKKDEISWKGEKYDLLRYRVAGDTLVAMAYHDAEEKDLENRISESRDEQKSERLLHSQRELPPFICTYRQAIVLFGMDTCRIIEPSCIPVSNRDLPGVFIPPCLS